ncbi:MAG: hypothetical protein A2148_08925 [Chloroflexi bacterium RBG_16_68_14]|nr:MAG: hypothetical protein A2148_08925 [Chloroflexi bacterium RBG_16_68_14]
MMPMQPRLDLAILADRLQRLLRLDTTVFEEVRQDPAATIPSVLVAVAATALAGLGGWIWWIVQDFGDSGKVLVQSVILGSIFSVALWIVWLLVAWVILTQLFREEADWQQMLRTMGMAAAPLALSVALFIPGIDFGVGLASVALFFGLTAIAIQAVTPANPARVLVANLAGFAVWAIVLGLLVSSDDYLAPGVFLFDAPSEILSEIADITNFDIDFGDLSQ